ncbi:MULTISPECIES: TonB-dependent siderophore receptor [unclassified Lentimonas]|uniref:TonB-dependent receptor plug domain-containing protein n=1 Tax=unclassified Lentimonas TaxID=2630993 RepID=UPI0013249D7A|nr:MULTISPECIES: TonB-dependent receptor [unclassified Lentimonas]CAA6690188.1 Outer membrane vitamin B12 receptor BtuB [Lentimonas sp. CC19]CAA6690871.1 Outer membrane vitamin B12 receptor BtuB [Lentimonas sp. CC10]CAA7068467.1 Outer membrane vitamin B12 receptor BtuB [Lentimonas sp. CC11]
MTYTTKLSIASAIAAFAGSVCLHADDQPARNQDTADASPELADYVVVAHTYEVPLDEVGSKVELITREDLEIGQSVFVTDALREVPSVLVRNNGGMGNAFGMTIRGLNGDNPVVFVDGIKVSNPMTGRMLNPGLIFSDTIESIELLKGPQSSLYGADALAGVLNMTTRKPAEGETNSIIKAGYGTDDTRQASASLLMNEGKWDLSMSLNRYSSDGYSSLSGDNEDDGYKNTAANLKVGYAVNDDLELYLASYYIDSEADYDTSLADNSGKNDSEQIFAKTGAIFQATDIWETQLSFAYTGVDNEDKNDTWGKTPFKADRYETEWRNVVTVNESWTVASGAGYEHNENRDTHEFRSNASYYVDNNFEVIENLFWTIGGRYDHPSGYSDKKTWRTTFSYLVEPINSRFHGSYGTSFKAPSLYNLTYNPDLKHQEGEGWDIGVEVTLFEDTVIFDVTAFGYDIDDKMTWDPTAPGAWPGWPGAMVNENYESDGVETSLIWKIQPDLTFRGSYTYTDATSDVNKEPLYTPKHQASVSLTWRTLEDKLDLKGSVLYIGERNAQFGSTEESPDYATVNLAAQYAISEVWTVWTSANNILDKDYEEIVGYGTPGFNMMAGVRVNF